jgi:hypothetical protein
MKDRLIEERLHMHVCVCARARTLARLRACVYVSECTHRCMFLCFMQQTTLNTQSLTRC